MVVVVKASVGATQVIAPLVVVKIGAAVPVTAVADVLVQPLVVLVTFKVYVPTAFTVGVKVFAPELMFPPLEAVHKYVKLLPDDPVPCKIVLLCRQVIDCAGPALAVGGVTFAVTAVAALALQLFSELVTFNR